jgi:hypothetical protein
VTDALQVPTTTHASSSSGSGVAGSGTFGITPRGARERSEAQLTAGQAFTALSKIESGHEAELSLYLTSLGTNIDRSTDIVCSELRLVHFMRWVIVRDTGGAAWLAFESNHDGSLVDHLAELLDCGASGIHQIYRHCVGYPCGQSNAIGPDDIGVFTAFLRGGSLPSGAFHLAMHGKTAERIRREAAIRDKIENFLDEHRPAIASASFDADELHANILQHLDPQQQKWALEMQPRPPVSAEWPWILRVMPLVLVVLPVALPLYLLLRIREAFDLEDEPKPETPGIRELAEREDFQVQNQLTHVVDIKPGLFRRLLLKAVLWVIDLKARFSFNQGSLGGITTIHFARWVIFDGGRRLLFFSNYDGSWESYLGDFVDKAAKGLTGVWSNTKGFPKTKGLVNLGATDEERFKSWTRDHQVTTQLWYSAYPELTVRNIQRNAKICTGLAQKPATREAMLAWLECL